MATHAHTKTLLAAALRQLMEHTTIEGVNVQQLCGLCGVHRKTFYYHFESKYALLHWVLRSECIQPLLDNPPATFAQAFAFVVRAIGGSRAFYTNAFRAPPNTSFGNTFSNSFQDYFIEQVKLLIGLYNTPKLPRQGEEVDGSEYQTYYADTLAGSLMGNVQQWLLEHPQLSVEGYLELLQTTILKPGELPLPG